MLHAEITTPEYQASHIANVLTVAELPPRYNRRWSTAQQQQVLAAIDAGVLTPAEATARYALTAEDLASWRRQESAQTASLTNAHEAELPAVQATPAIDRLTRLIEVLLERRLIDDFDVISLDAPRQQAMTKRLAEFMVDDAPLF